ncbi:AGE family epimerase/isomerase [Nereida sp. MMG025]|uniref:AGE family epimerase/isomerase n=1 Tax=Nereida sp. MMG025 TaxID=2909981 RepID=UPI001F289E38|nr:AGE family epimerase/isomerase [Nereida sp. MMG025]MCF6445877.1 AGE family epimerase/isomerase [Nereida sp. MMG025]
MPNSHTPRTAPGPASHDGFWLDTPEHRAWLIDQAQRQWFFFDASLTDRAGFATLGPDGRALPDTTQELHTTTRLIHSYALGHLMGHNGASAMVERGMSYLRSHHHDTQHGGYLWALDAEGIKDDRKLAYGHMFVLLAAASAKMAGHADADDLMADVRGVLEAHYWEEDMGLFCDEFSRDWTPFSDYRGMNANMHGVEAHLTAFEATGEASFLDRAGRILDFFTAKMAPHHSWRLPEHYTADWQIDREYSGDAMFRPSGTTPGHSFEFGRLLLQHWDLSGRPDTDAPVRARKLIEQALSDAWMPEGGFAYTLDFDGSVSRDWRFWWPVTEAIGAVAALIKLDRQEGDEVWYRRLWRFADAHFIDHDRGGWFPEIDAHGKVTSTIFAGKPDIYHALQACLYPLTPRLSRHADDLGAGAR